MRVVLLQCELEHRHQAPHLAGALFASDLRRAGHEVRCALVHPSALSEAAAWLADAELVLLDPIFPFAMTRVLKGATQAPFVVGGHNALQHLLRGPVDAALVGPGRAGVRALAAVLAAGGEWSQVPGLWFRGATGAIDCGPVGADASPASEVLPFTPDLDWDYLGPPRAPGSNRRVPSIVAELGCVWNRTAMTIPAFADVAPRRPDLPFSERAAARFDAEFLGREGGCTFCTFRFLPRRGHRVERTLELLVTQAAAHVADGARGISVQTEHPLPWLAAAIDALAAAGLTDRLDEIHVRTIPWLLLRHEANLALAIERARAHGVQLVLAQVGFEAFDDPTLAIYNKGLDAATNRRAARLLTRLEAEHAPSFLGTGGHGLVPLHPWSRPEDLRETIAAVRADAPWLAHTVGPFARIELYNEWTPLFWKAQSDGLLRCDDAGFGWSWRYADARMEEVTAASAAILARRKDRPAIDVLADVVSLVLSEPDAAQRRCAYLALRDEGLSSPPSP